MTEFEDGVMIEMPEKSIQQERKEQYWDAVISKAERGNVWAQSKLGWRYCFGDISERDIVQGLRWLHAAAEQGDDEARFNLGVLYSNGCPGFVIKDEEHAATLFQMAAESGFARAQYQLGVYNEHGIGMPKNLRAAKDWYKKAAAQGFGLANLNRKLHAIEEEEERPRREMAARNAAAELERRRKEEETRRAAEDAEMRRKEQENRFRKIVCLFIVAAKLAKSDGRVSASEVEVAERIFCKFNIGESERGRYVDVFNKAVKSTEDVYSYADVIYREFPLEIRHFIYELLWDVACADGVVVDAELNLLKGLTCRLGLSQTVFENCFSHRRGLYRGVRYSLRLSSDRALQGALALIGIGEEASIEEIKSAYRAKIKTYHPDVLRGKGVPEDLIVIANSKVVELNRAWALICEKLGI